MPHANPESLPHCGDDPGRFHTGGLIKDICRGSRQQGRTPEEAPEGCLYKKKHRHRQASHRQVRGVLTTAIDNQQVITTKVTLPEQETERRKALIKALDKIKLRKALYKAFRVKAPEPQDGPTQAGPTIVPLSSLPSKHPKASLLDLLPPPSPCKV